MASICHPDEHESDKNGSFTTVERESEAIRDWFDRYARLNPSRNIPYGLTWRERQQIIIQNRQLPFPPDSSSDEALSPVNTSSDEQSDLETF